MPNNTSTVLQIQAIGNLDKDQKLETTIKSTMTGPPFLALGRYNFYDGKTLMNSYALTAGFTKVEAWLMIQLEEKRDWHTNVAECVISPKQRNKMDKAYRILKAKEVIIRLKQNTYLINPNYIKPIDYAIVLSIWNSVKI